MTATFDIPDDLYHKAEAKAARSGARLREVAVNLFECWVQSEVPPAGKPSSADQWLDEWVRLGADTCAGLPASPTTRDLLHEGRNRTL